MHYNNGREAKIGDRIIMRDPYGAVAAGTLVSANAGSDTCNGKIVPLGTPTTYVTLKDCLHIDDVMPADPVKQT